MTPQFIAWKFALHLFRPYAHWRYEDVIAVVLGRYRCGGRIRGQLGGYMPVGVRRRADEFTVEIRNGRDVVVIPFEQIWRELHFPQPSLFDQEESP